MVDISQKKINTTQIKVPIKAFLKNVYTTQKQVPIKAFLIAIGITSFIGFSTYHDFFSSTDVYYEDGYADDPYPDDARIWRLQSKIDNLYSSMEIEDPVNREELDQIRTLNKQIERIIVNKRHNRAVANYIFYTLSIYVGLLLGRGGEFEKSHFFGFFRKLYNHIKEDKKIEDEKPHKPTLHFKYSDNWKNYPLNCGCGWKGKLDEDWTELHSSGITDFTCPDCDKMLAIISSSGGEGIGGVITPFKSKKDPVQMDEQEDSFVKLRENFLNKFDKESLKSSDQLPDLDENSFAFVWDDNFIEGKTVILFGDKVIWSEPKIWEGAERFVEVVEILKAKYGKKFVDLIPTEGSYLYLLGDRYS